MDGVEESTLKYYIANDNLTVEIDDHHELMEGVDGTRGGFSRVIITPEAMNVTFFNQDADTLYEYSIPPRLVGQTPADASSLSVTNPIIGVAIMIASGAAVLTIVFMIVRLLYVSQRKRIDRKVALNGTSICHVVTTLMCT
jgi:hypothetical protein